MPKAAFRISDTGTPNLVTILEHRQLGHSQGSSSNMNIAKNGQTKPINGRSIRICGVGVNPQIASPRSGLTEIDLGTQVLITNRLARQESSDEGTMSSRLSDLPNRANSEIEAGIPCGFDASWCKPRPTHVTRRYYDFTRITCTYDFMD